MYCQNDEIAEFEVEKVKQPQSGNAAKTEKSTKNQIVGNFHLFASFFWQIVDPFPRNGFSLKQQTASLQMSAAL